MDSPIGNLISNCI